MTHCPSSQTGEWEQFLVAPPLEGTLVLGLPAAANQTQQTPVETVLSRGWGGGPKSGCQAGWPLGGSREASSYLSSIRPSG